MRKWWEVKKVKIALRLVGSVRGDHHASFVNLDILDACDHIRQLLRWLK